jgi:hypothetical protein
MDPKDNKKAAIWLSDADSLKFKQFLEHYEVFSILMSSKVFEMKNANVTLNFDGEGSLRTVTRNDVLYRKISPVEIIVEKVK